MPSPCLLINPEDPDLKTKITTLAKTPGICIFIDITGSTAMKCSTLTEWLAKIHNCFANSHTFLSPFAPIKSIGDALMYFIEESDLIQTQYNALQIYDGLWQIATEGGPEFPNVKIGAVWCEDVYPITFLAGSRDYYGIDVDLAARLQAMADSKEVVIDFRLHEKIRLVYEGAGNRSQFESVRRLVGPEKVAPKGIPNKVLIYRGC